MKELRMLSTFALVAALFMLPGFTCSRNIPKEGNISADYSLIAYKGTVSKRVSSYNTLADCLDLKSKLEEKNPDVVYRCRK